MNEVSIKTNEHAKEYDCLRVIATLLVVLGHSSYYVISGGYGGCDYSYLLHNGCITFELLQKVTRFIYLFHMPLFVALSGALFWKSKERGKYESFSQIFAAKAKRLMIPFFVVNVLYVIPLKYITGYFSECKYLLRDITVGQLLTQGNNHLWYCASLFFIFMISFFLEKYIKGKKWCKLLVLLIVSILSSSIKIQLFSSICRYLFWFYVGFYFDSNRKRFQQLITRKFWIFATSGVMILYVVFLLFKNQNTYPFQCITVIVKYALTILLCMYVYAISFLLSGTKLVEGKVYRTLRDDSFGIYLYSDTWNYVILFIGVRIFGSFLFENNLGALALYGIRFVVTLFISIGVTELLKKCKVKYIY